MSLVNVATQLLKSSVGKKFIMGLSGIGFYGFVMIHMAGNLTIFISPEMYNLYGHQITSNPIYPLLSYGLMAIFLVHIFMGILLTKQNKEARPSSYAVNPHAVKDSTLAAKTMIVSGSVLLVFLILHLASFKYGAYYEANYNGVVVRDLARLIFELFQNPAYVVWYVVALLVMMVHLKHGVASSFQSIGLNHPKYNGFIKVAGIAYAVVVSLGFISQPLYVYFFH